MLLLFFILGLVMGSFYMVVGLRMSNNESIIFPRSHCTSCGKKLSWYELVPVLSYLFLNGKCSKCKSKISIFYPIIELLSGILFALSYYLYGISYNLIIALVISSLLIIIFVSDFKYYIILDQPLIIALIIVLIVKYFQSDMIVLCKSIISGTVLFLFLLVVKLIGDYLYKRESLGGGDIKLSAFIGVVLGVRLGFAAIVVGSFIALPMALVINRVEKHKEVPFGPFLILATYLIFIFMEPINNFLSLYLNIG